jgi:alpha-tubulin suppressor-like RCC1 family protein
LGLDVDEIIINIPTLIKELKDVKAIATNGYHSLALSSQGRVYTWGSAREGELGIEKNIILFQFGFRS